MADLATHFREYVRLDRKRTASGLTVAEMERWRVLKRGLTREFAPDVKQEEIDRRASLRVPTRLRVSFATEGALAESLMTNFSRMGVFIETNRPFELKTRFELNIYVGEPQREITATVEVVSNGLGPALQAGQQGMGCRFVDLSPDVEKQIADLYERSVE